MIFAELTERPNVEDLLKVLNKKFRGIEWGDQGTKENPDAYFWIKREGVMVAVDNFTSVEFQVKCVRSGAPLIQEVIDVLAETFSIRIYDEPEREAHE